MNIPDSYFVEKKSLYWFLIIVIVAIFFRLYNLATPSLWTDEFSTLWSATAPTLKESYQRSALTQGMHPLYFLIQHSVLSILPHSEGTLRGLSCTASILSIFFIFWLARIIFNDDLRALIASAIFAIHADSIYYAQEARPYALGLLLAIISQIFLLRFSQLGGWRNSLFCTLFSTLAFYMHYTFASIFIFQNLYIAIITYLKNKSQHIIDKKRLHLWIISQFFAILLILPSLHHIIPLFSSRFSWTWLKNYDLYESFLIFLSMFNPKMLLIVAIVGIIFFIMEPFSIKSFLERINLPVTIFLLGWLITPFIFNFAISRILNTSFLDPRYMLLSTPAYYLLLANILDLFRSDILRTTFPGVYLIIYIGFISIPNYMQNGVFCNRVPHNWKTAITHIKENFQTGDVILLRFGDIKENWIPLTDNKIIHDFVKAPFHSFYWNDTPKSNPPKIYNLTYSWEKEFYNYYDFLFNELVKAPRTWLIGVNPPNTNYKISSTAVFMQKEFSFKKLWDADHSGVYIALLEPDPILRRKALLPSYIDELKQSIHKDRKGNQK